MKYRPLEIKDCALYQDDILGCYNDNAFILDAQSPLKLNTPVQCQYFILGYIEADDSMVLGIFSDDEKYLYGLIIFDNIRIVENDSVAQVHIVTSRAIWGKRIRDIYSAILKSTLFSRLFCEIPVIAAGAIAMCKRLGFKKTGYIPKALPYTNAVGETKLYDINTYVWSKDNGKA